nr:glutamate receptor Gr3 [Bombyx mori]
MACCPDVRRKAPTNFIFLAIFTAAQSFLLGISASVYQADAVLMAVGITAAVCLGLTLFALQTKWDFTMMGGVLLCATIVLLVFGIVAIFVKGKVITLVYASLGALIFSIYLVYDTQLMMGGKHKYSISPEEYIFAALNLYLDIINIFLFILTIIGASRD